MDFKDKVVVITGGAQGIGRCITEEFQKAMKNYFTGNATKEEALDMFKTAVHEKYPDVSVD